MLPDFVFLKHGATSIWVDEKLNKPSVLELILDPERLFSDEKCIVIKDQTKIKVARVPLELSGLLCSVFIKRYNAFSLRSRLFSLFPRSGAVRSLQGAAILRDAGIATAMPVAALESRRLGVVTKSFYFSKEIPGGKTADAYWREDLTTTLERQRLWRRRRFLSGLAWMFHTLHQLGIYHNDLKDANILVVSDSGTESFYLIDLEGIRHYSKVNFRRRIKNIVQLNRTLGRLLRRAEKMYFLKIYLGSRFTSKLIKRRWVRTILEQSKRRDLKTQRTARQLF
jgi:serine/threonine protein kinase